MYSWRAVPVFGSVASVMTCTVDRLAGPELLTELRRQYHRLVNGIGLEEPVQRIGIGEDALHDERRCGGDLVPQRDAVGVGRGVDDGDAHILDVDADGKAEQHHFDDRQQDEHHERTAVAEDVIAFLAEQPPQRRHHADAPAAASASASRANRTKSSSIESTPCSRLSASGVPAAATRPATIIKSRSQYSASSI